MGFQWVDEERESAEFGKEIVPVMYNMTNGKKTNVRLEICFK